MDLWPMQALPSEFTLMIVYLLLLVMNLVRRWEMAMLLSTTLVLVVCLIDSWLLASLNCRLTLGLCRIITMSTFPASLDRFVIIGMGLALCLLMIMVFAGLLLPCVCGAL